MVVILNRLTMVNLIGKVIFKALFDYAKAFDCVDHNKPWNILKEIVIPEHLT